MKNINRYDCGNGEGMFDISDGYYVAYDDYKLLLDKYDKLALTIPVVVEQCKHKYDHYTNTHGETVAVCSKCMNSYF